MNLWFRLFWLFISACFRPPIPAPFGMSVLHLRVWPNDLDLSMHMNNGRYLTLMDLGRIDLMLGMGLAGASFKAGWTPILSASVSNARARLLRVLVRVISRSSAVKVVW